MQAVSLAMHSSVPLLSAPASIDTAFKLPVAAASAIARPPSPTPSCQLSPCAAKTQWGEGDASLIPKFAKQSCELVTKGLYLSPQPTVRTEAVRTTASVGVLERLEESNASQRPYLDGRTGSQGPGFMDDQSGPGVPVDHNLEPPRIVGGSSPRTRTIEKPHPNAQAESSEESRLGAVGSILNPEQDVQPVLSTFAPDTFAARAQPPSLLVFSGGTAFNGVVEDLKHFTTRVSHVLPVSDDGGSTAEIVRVLGGPAVGDIRSRCLRLSDESSEEALAVKRLLGHRLPVDARGAKMEWYSIVEGEHELWTGVSDPYKDTIRAFLVHFHTQILRHSSERFSFQNGSIGNFFFAGARTFFRSMDAAIFTYSSISAIPKDSLVLPAVSTNDRLVLGAELRNGGIIRGQNMISHPSPAELEQSGVRNVNKAPGACPPLPSPIKRVFYMSTEGTHLLQEVFPKVNPNVVKNLDQVDAIIYGMGSLYTSICPSLILRGVGEAIAARDCPKVFLLNGTHDRETAGMAASDFVLAVCNALNRTHGEDRGSRLYYLPPTYVTVFLVPEGGQIPVDIEKLHSIGITRVVTVPSEVADNGSVVFNSNKLIETLGNVIANTPPALAD